MMNTIGQFGIISLLAASTVWAEDAPARREWPVGDVKREAMVYAPSKAKTEAAPAVFVFHGHGGTMRNTVRTFAVHQRWPEAIVVYPQGLNTPGRLTDPQGKKSGWQSAPGDQGDRDLKFFDAMMESLSKEYRVDANRVYSTGHSNGGGFTYLLWAMRGDSLAAVAPSGAAAFSVLGRLKPKPVLHLAGEKDPLVRFEWQKRMIDVLLKLNDCGPGQPGEKYCTLYPSQKGNPVMTYIHPGGHEFPRDAPAIMVKFFKDHARP